MKLALLIAYSYIIGSVPFGMILAKIKGVDLRGAGSGNIGATNVLRAMGRMPAILTLMGDLLKGTAAVAVGRILGVGPLYEGILGLSAIAGHNFSIFLKFRGGKGVATSLGVILIYLPEAGILTVGLWLFTTLITRYSSLAAVVSFGFLPFGAFIFGGSKEQVAVSIVIALLLIIRHSENIKKLLKGTERRIGEKKA
ncbi:MAG: glycerol-3-phosphate 1-O-acyltransferase PlsY [Thermodesulfovibrionales bacterium]|nr:glycerol-3-phosphate 1-O-acyltransferase PlsY [Thermodesulfovibrionales bacterium]